MLKVVRTRRETGELVYTWTTEKSLPEVEKVLAVLRKLETNRPFVFTVYGQDGQEQLSI